MSAPDSSYGLPPPSEVRAELERLISSSMFIRSERLRRFLTLTVEWTLEGREEDLKEYTLGREVFDRRADYDPRNDSIVRVEAQRLRKKLQSFYATVGNRDPVEISFHPGHYAPEFRWRETAPAGGDKLVGGQSGEPALNPKLIAVMPFAALNMGAQLEYVIDDLWGTIIERLMMIPGLRTLERSRSAEALREFRGPDRMCRALGVGTRVEGSLRKTGDSLYLTAVVRDLGTGRALWGSTMARPERELFAMQDQAARSIATAIRACFGLSPIPPAPRPHPSLEAYRAYLEARYSWSQMTAESLRAALDRFTWAIALDAGYAPAYAGLADVYYGFPYLSILPAREAVPKAKRAALEALRLDPAMVEPRATLAALLFLYDREWIRAEEMFRQAIEVNSGYAGLWMQYGLLLLAEGRSDRGLAAFERALELDPLAPRTACGCGLALYLCRRFAEAQPWLEAAVEMAPGMVAARAALIRTRLAAGQYRAALECAQELPLASYSIVEQGAVAAAYARNGATSEATAILENLLPGARPGYTDPIGAAEAYAGLGDVENTLRFLAAVVEQRSPFAAEFHLDALFDFCRDDARFRALVAQLNLPEGPEVSR